MSDFDDFLAQLKKGLGEMADDVREKYADLSAYLDSHSKDEIANDLKEMFGKTVDEAKEKFSEVKEEVEENVNKMKADYQEAKESGKIDDKINEVKEDLRENAEKAKQVIDKGIATVEDQIKDLRKMLGL